MWNLADAPYYTKRETLLNFCCENGVSPLLYSHVKSLVRITFYVLWCIWGEVLSDFCHENKVKCRLIFAVEIKQWLQTHLEIIDRDHTYSDIKSQSLTHLKPRKLMLIVCSQLPMSLNYDFTKTKDCPWTDVVGCLTPSPHITKLPNSRIKIFYPSTLD